MLHSDENSNIPRIGDIVHFYPNDETRVAALVVETHPCGRDDSDLEISIPDLSLQVFYPEGKMVFMKKVEPVFRKLDDMDMTEEIDPTGKWTPRDQIAILQNGEDEQVPGTNANFHVGSLQD